MCVQVHMNLCTHVWRLEVNFRCCSKELHTLFSAGTAPFPRGVFFSSEMGFLLLKSSKDIINEARSISYSVYCAAQSTWSIVFQYLSHLKRNVRKAIRGDNWAAQNQTTLRCSHILKTLATPLAVKSLDVRTPS